MYAIIKDIICVEIDKDTYFQIHQFKISPCLLEKNILKFLYAFQLYNNPVFNKQIQTQRCFQQMSIIMYRYIQLPFDIKTSLL